LRQGQRRENIDVEQTFGEFDIHGGRRSVQTYSDRVDQNVDTTKLIQGFPHQCPSKTVVCDVSGGNQFLAVAMVLKTRPGQRRQGEFRALLSQLPGACGANPFGCARDQYYFVFHTRESHPTRGAGVRVAGSPVIEARRHSRIQIIA